MHFNRSGIAKLSVERWWAFNHRKGIIFAQKGSPDVSIETAPIHYLKVFFRGKSL